MLRALLGTQGHVFAYGVSSPLSAYIAESAGHKVLYAGGYAAAAERRLPDIGLVTQTEMLQHMKYIAAAVNVPVMADIDDGYGGIHNVQRTVTEMISETEVAGMHLEDQRSPKRCGHMRGKEVIPLEEAVGKLRIAIKTRDRLDPMRIIMARTDAFSAAGNARDDLAGGDIKEAIRRGHAYADTGADLVWCEFPKPNRISAEMFAEGMRDHWPQFGLGFNISPSFSWNEWADHVTYKELLDLGYTFLFVTYPSIVASAMTSEAWAKSFREDPIDALKHLQRYARYSCAESIMRLVGVPEYQALEEEYSPHAAENLRTSEGFREI